MQTTTSNYPAFVQLKAAIIQAKSKLEGVESSFQQKENSYVYCYRVWKKKGKPTKTQA
ncbi:hypothetical protein HMPREF1248_1260 [Coriobacteriaceae bacterium BV3Ac1]|nr:hypothetical protein HMPREF1248_1260 [Coriobacteriaceae bacterium BV3Ac1]